MLRTESMDFAAWCHLGMSPLALGNAASAEAAPEEECLDLVLDEDFERDPDDLLLEVGGIASSSNVPRNLDRPERETMD